jgi:hypothetical protein
LGWARAGAPPDPETLTACALVGVAAFPVVGNALAWLVGMPRRASQALVLVLFASLVAYGWCRLHPGGIPVRDAVRRRLSYALLVSAALVAGLSVIAVARGAWPPTYAVSSAMVVPLWLTLAVASLLGWVRVRQPEKKRCTTSPAFNRFICALLFALALIAYFRGPDTGEVVMAFGGSTTVAGTSAAILGGVALGALRGWYRPIGLLLAVYLSFLATSRTGVLLFVVLFAAISVAAWIDARDARARRRKLAGDCALFLICIVVVVFPAQFSAYYPYFSSRPGEAGARLVYGEEKLAEWELFELRYGRIGRLIQDPGQGEAAAGTGLVERLEGADNRWEILLRTIRVVAANPWGYWPQPFEQVAKIRCARPPLCRYPHNVVLEVGFHFGWIPLGLVALGLLVLGIRTVATLNHGAVTVRVTAIALLGYLVFAQFSGDLLDNLVAVGLGMLWMALVGSDATDGRSRASLP